MWERREISRITGLQSLGLEVIRTESREEGVYVISKKKRQPIRGRGWRRWRNWVKDCFARENIAAILFLGLWTRY